MRADTCITPDGATITPWYVMEFSNWFDCLTIDAQGNVILLDHYRQGVGEYVPEIPAGGIDGDGETTEAGVRRELLEETGYEGGTCTIAPIKEFGADFAMRKVPLAAFVREMARLDRQPTMQAMHITTIWLGFNYILRRGAHAPEVAKLRKHMSELGS